MKELVMHAARINKNLKNQVENFCKKEDKTNQWVMENALDKFINNKNDNALLELQKEINLNNDETFKNIKKYDSSLNGSKEKEEYYQKMITGIQVNEILNNIYKKLEKGGK